ncbi:MAG: ABC transporter substrate-binding protein [Lachnospiraceae bacterium]|nr:ABC transporter substrate-binding protein [Lachnospiraceae bacterium]MBQ9608237.1 ABC transporter substrate-binding protein [Lachnospiraceae bacterium]
MINYKKKSINLILCILLIFSLMLTGCGANKKSNNEVSSDTDAINEEAPLIEGLHFKEIVPLDYAECFTIYRYEEGYSLISISDGRNYLLVPEGKDVPECAKDYYIIKKPVSDIYLASTSTMALFNAMDALDMVGTTSLNADDWHIDAVKEAMEEERIVFAGKYSEPDYEYLMDDECKLAIENTMILHTPEVQEKLEELGITVFIDCSSYEDHPLGRSEWIKVYAEITDRQDEADAFFAEQKKYVEELSDYESTGKTVAYFYINESGSVVVRKTSDYIPKMIEIAGGDYIFDDLGADDEKASSSTNITMEEFYNTAKDVDYLIYNATIDNPLHSIDELIDKNALFAEFKAVKNDNVWCTEKNMFQATDVIGNIIGDFHTVFTDDDAETLEFLYRIH